MKATLFIKPGLILVLICLIACRESRPKDPDTAKRKDSAYVVTGNPDKSIPARDSVDTPDPIAAIKSEFARINSAQLTKKSYSYQCDELMKIDYYYEGNNVVKAVVDYGTVGDHYQKSEFYYKDGKLFFFYDFVEGGPACEGCGMRLEQRYYVQNDQVIRYIKNNTAEKCEVCSFSQKSAPYRTLKAGKTLDFKTAFCS